MFENQEYNYRLSIRGIQGIIIIFIYILRSYINRAADELYYYDARSNHLIQIRWLVMIYMENTAVFILGTHFKWWSDFASLFYCISVTQFTFLSIIFNQRVVDHVIVRRFPYAQFYLLYHRRQARQVADNQEEPVGNALPMENLHM